MKLARTKEWRESQGLTQRELAAKAGVGEVTVARVETDASVAPATARKIAEALGVSVADLLERPPVPLTEPPSRPGILVGEEQLEDAGPPKDRQHWDRVLASVHERQRDVEATVKEVVALPAPSKADRSQVQWALDEAQKFERTLLLALPGSYVVRHRDGQEKIVMSLSAVDPDQWEEVGKEVGNAQRFYADIVDRLVQAGLVELKPQPVLVAL